MEEEKIIADEATPITEEIPEVVTNDVAVNDTVDLTSPIDDFTVSELPAFEPPVDDITIDELPTIEPKKDDFSLVEIPTIEPKEEEKYTFDENGTVVAAKDDEKNEEVSEEVEEEATEDNATEEVQPAKEENTYDKIRRLNMSLDELSNDISVDSDLDNKERSELINEISMPEISSEEMRAELGDAADDKSQEELANEITSTDDEYEDSAASSKGQFILIGILSIILIALLVAMIIFTNAL